ncbi:aminopeptidase P family protein [Formicincola oecophyllae]|uniref:Aminopeptidase P family protein n=1 Tax=Formicincola oecophyllae TaxID=2558361 RepID=A0A4Y6UDV8_9PROT|nr:aminopeptidase P family protein [Formicincola oecophyllae]QDH14205.1 aminopeptidase P family protein [Formicincola oecophyllae]
MKPGTQPTPPSQRQASAQPGGGGTLPGPLPLEQRPEAAQAALEAISIALVPTLGAPLDAYVVPRSDAWLGEYVPPADERLAWLTGFTGSAGAAVLHAHPSAGGLAGAVFSDSRYTTQMAQQAPEDLWTTHSSNPSDAEGGLAGHLGRLAQARTTKGPLLVGYDPTLTSAAMLKNWQGANPPERVRFTPAPNPVDAAWHDQPPPPAGSARFLKLDHAGERNRQKRARAGAALARAGAAAALLGDATSVAWLLNMRGDDLAMVPVTRAHALLHADGTAELFLQPERMSAPDRARLAAEGVSIHHPQAMAQRLQALAGQRVGVDPATVTLHLANLLEKAGAETVPLPDPTHPLRAVKNAVEQQGQRQAQLIDGVAIVRFLHALEGEGVGQSESALARRLDGLRLSHPQCVGLSFDTISATGPHAALPHYRALPGQDAILGNGALYLVDSGGQYPFGTTDITRTWWVGDATPPDDIMEAYTRVLKGHIALATLVFPAGTPGSLLDSFARAPLWAAGLDYGHGTGHGVGSYLSVHEGPHSITPGNRHVGFEAGMIVSNEPGYYRPGDFGIRTENLLLAVPAPFRGEGKAFLAFETLTLAPINRRLIKRGLLNSDELAWLDHYHGRVLSALTPRLEGQLRQESAQFGPGSQQVAETRAVLEWLERACAPLEGERT